MKKLVFLLLLAGCEYDPDYYSTYDVKCYAGTELMLEDIAKHPPVYSHKREYQWYDLDGNRRETSLDCVITRIPPVKVHQR